MKRVVRTVVVLLFIVTLAASFGEVLAGAPHCCGSQDCSVIAQPYKTCSVLGENFEECFPYHPAFPYCCDYGGWCGR